MNKALLSRSIDRWMRTYQPGLLESLEDHPAELQQYREDKLQAMLEDYATGLRQLDSEVMRQIISPEQRETRERMLQGQVMADHLPVMSVEEQLEQPLTREAQKRLDAREKELKDRWDAMEMTPEERDGLWEEERASELLWILEVLEMEAFDAE